MNGYFNNTRSLFHLVSYHFSVLFRKIRPYPPFVFWMLYLGIAYQQTPLNMVQNYLASAMISFFVMVWFGYVFLSDFDVVTEHLLILQINNRLLYATSKIIFLMVVCVLVSLIGGVYPIIIEIISHLAGVTWPIGIGVADFFGGLFLHFIVGCLGVSVAFLFQPNPDKRSNNPITVFALMLFTLMAVIKHQIFSFDGLARYILLVFTPTYEILQMFPDRETFVAGDMLLTLTKGGIYFGVAVVVGYWSYNKRVYGSLIAKHK